MSRLYKFAFLLSSVLLFLPNQSYAGSDGSAVSNNADLGKSDPSCRLLTRDAVSHKLKSICSGVLTQKSIVTTAAHCVADAAQKNTYTEVSCGFLGSDPRNVVTEKTDMGNAVHTKGVKFIEEKRASEAWIDKDYDNDLIGHDLGFIKLDSPSSIEPLEADTATQVRKKFFDKNGVLLPPVECRSSGFGLNSKHFAGELSSVPHIKVLDDFKISGDQWQIYQDTGINMRGNDYAKWKNTGCKLPYAGDDPKMFLQFAALNNLITSTMMQGDSGGPLYCRTSKASNWVLIGIANMVNASVDTPGRKGIRQVWSPTNTEKTHFVRAMSQ